MQWTTLEAIGSILQDFRIIHVLTTIDVTFGVINLQICLGCWLIWKIFLDSYFDQVNHLVCNGKFVIHHKNWRLLVRRVIDCNRLIWCSIFLCFVSISTKLLNERELLDQIGAKVIAHSFRIFFSGTPDHTLQKGKLVPDQGDSSLYDAAFAIWAHTFDQNYFLAVKGVAVRNVSRPIQTQNLDSWRAALQNTIGFHGRGGLDNYAVDFECCINRAHLQHRHVIVGFIFITWVRPRCDWVYLRAFTRVELIDWIGRVRPIECFETVLDWKADLNTHHLHVLVFQFQRLLEGIKLGLWREVWRFVVVLRSFLFFRFLKYLL